MKEDTLKKANDLAKRIREHEQALDCFEYDKSVEASELLLHYHLCEQEGVGSGQPTPAEWLEAVDKLSEALGYNSQIKELSLKS